MGQEPFQLRKSAFRKYYMVTQEAAPVLVHVASEYPYAMKILLYFMNQAGRLNKVENKDYKMIQKAYLFRIEEAGSSKSKEKSISTSTISKNIQELQRMELIDTDFDRYNKEFPKGKKQKKGTIHTYVLNPQLVWSTYLDMQAECRFPKKNKEFKKLLCGLNGVQDKVGSIEEDNIAKQYYMVNKNYENDFYWLAQQNMKSIAILFYFMQKMNTKNEVGNIKYASYNSICSHCHVSRQGASRAIALLKRYHFVEVRKKGQYNVYIVNPEIAWSANQYYLSSCEFPQNLSVNTPCLRQRINQAKTESINYDQLAKELLDGMEKISKSFEEQMELSEKLKLRKHISEELIQLYESFQHPVLPDLFRQLIEKQNGENDERI